MVMQWLVRSYFFKTLFCHKIFFIFPFIRIQDIFAVWINFSNAWTCCCCKLFAAKSTGLEWKPICRSSSLKNPNAEFDKMLAIQSPANHSRNSFLIIIFVLCSGFYFESFPSFIRIASNHRTNTLTKAKSFGFLVLMLFRNYFSSHYYYIYSYIVWTRILQHMQVFSFPSSISFFSFMARYFADNNEHQCEQNKNLWSNVVKRDK